jgi:hypothetical protein
MKLLASLALTLIVVASASFAMADPPPPQIPRDFQWEGRYFVKDLGVNVSFSWQGNDGDTQMIAGSEEEAIHFTNLIYHDQLYTLTYKWDQIVPPGPVKCVCLGQLPLETLNQCLNSSRFVGAETLAHTRHPFVNHFRVSVAFGFASVDPALRFAAMQADIYVERRNPSRIRKMLHFGYQNILDPALDEWLEVDRIKNKPGDVTLPPECSPPLLQQPCSGKPAFPEGFFCK